MEIDNLRYIMTGYYCILEEQLFPEFQFGVTHTHMNCGRKVWNMKHLPYLLRYGKNIFIFEIRSKSLS